MIPNQKKKKPKNPKRDKYKFVTSKNTDFKILKGSIII